MCRKEQAGVWGGRGRRQVRPQLSLPQPTPFPPSLPRRPSSGQRSRRGGLTIPSAGRKVGGLRAPDAVSVVFYVRGLGREVAKSRIIKPVGAQAHVFDHALLGVVVGISKASFVTSLVV